MMSSYQKIVGKRLKRIYYHLEDQGLEYLNELIKEYYAVNECITKILEFSKGAKDENNVE